MFEDSRGRIWIGTYEGGAGAGVGCFDGKRWTRFTRRDGLIDDRVYCMFIDSRKKMWFGTECGVSRYDGTSWRSFTKTDGLVENLVRAILEDKEGSLWLGTYPYEQNKGGISIVRYAGKPETLQEKLQKLLPQSGEIVRLGPRKKLGKL